MPFLTRLNLNLVAALFGTWACLGADLDPKQFRIAVQQSRCPEYGTLLQTHVLYVGFWQTPFQPPHDWQTSSDASARRLSFSSPSFNSTVSFAINWKQRASDAPLTVDAPAGRTLLSQRYPGVRLTEESPCYVSGQKGVGFYFDYVDSLSRRCQGRFFLVPFAGGEIELAVTTCGEEAQAFTAFGMVANSLRLERIALRN